MRRIGIFRPLEGVQAVSQAEGKRPAIISFSFALPGLVLLIMGLGCAARAIPIERGELSRLREVPEVQAIHYIVPPLVAHPGLKPPPVPLYTTHPSPAGAGLELLFKILIGGLFDAAVTGLTSSSGPPQDYCWSDPIAQVKERFIAAWESQQGLPRVRPASDSRTDDDLAALQTAFGAAVLLDFKTTRCRVVLDDPSRSGHLATFAGRARLIRVEEPEPRVVWQGICELSGAEQALTPEAAATRCADELLVHLLGTPTAGR